MRVASLLLASAAAVSPFTLSSLPTVVPARVRAAAAQLEALLLSARDPQHYATLRNTTSSTYCPDQGAFDWVPITVANLSRAAPAAAIAGSGACFASVSATAAFGADGGVAVTLRGASPASLTCSDAFTLTTSYSLALPVELSALASTRTLAFPKWASPDEALDAALHGVHVALLPCGLVGSLASLLATVNLFIPLSLNASDMNGINERFLAQRRVWSGPGGRGSPLVPYGAVQDLDPALLRSGDYLAILRFDGLDPLIAFGTGLGATGHSAVLVWRGAGAARALYVIESTDGPALFGPPAFFGHGLTVTPFQAWVALARQSGFNVAVLPLAPRHAAAFSEDAVWAWFDPIVNTSYGYQNLLFSVLDTADPFTSLPLPIDEGVLLPVLNAADAVLGPAPAGNESTSLTVDTLLVHGLNKRLGTACATFACVIAAVNANRASGAPGLPASVLQAAAVPESDEWRYGGKVVFVCSGFAAAVYKVALGGALADFNATEQTPTDNVKWQLWDGAYWSSSNCPVGLWRPTNGSGTVWCVAVLAPRGARPPPPCARAPLSLHSGAHTPCRCQPNHGARAHAPGRLQHDSPLWLPQPALRQPVA